MDCRCPSPVSISLHIIQAPAPLCCRCCCCDLLCFCQLVAYVVGRGLVELEEVCSPQQQQLVVCVCSAGVMRQLKSLRGWGKGRKWDASVYKGWLGMSASAGLYMYVMLHPVAMVGLARLICEKHCCCCWLQVLPLQLLLKAYI